MRSARPHQIDPDRERGVLAPALRGEEAGFSALSDLSSPKVPARASKRVRGPEVAEDLAQEVFLQASTSRKGYRESDSILQIARQVGESEEAVKASLRRRPFHTDRSASELGQLLDGSWEVAVRGSLVREGRNRQERRSGSDTIGRRSVGRAGFEESAWLRRRMRGRGLLLPAVVMLSFTGCVMRTADGVRSHEDSLARTGKVLEADPLGVDPQRDVPGDAPLVHVVRAGETLSEIAARYGVHVSAICLLNRILDPHSIGIGQRLQIPRPEGAVPASPPPRARGDPPEPIRARVLLGEAEEHYLAARFERALESSREVEALLEGEAGGNELRARAAFVAGSALAGLGEDGRASEEFARVHALDSRFEPPAGWLSPRLGSLYGGASAR